MKSFSDGPSHTHVLSNVNAATDAAVAPPNSIGTLGVHVTERAFDRT